jgi:hypothetical protein
MYLHDSIICIQLFSGTTLYPANHGAELCGKKVTRRRREQCHQTGLQANIYGGLLVKKVKKQLYASRWIQTRRDGIDLTC